MLLKSQELNIKRKDFFKGKVVLLYGENHDLIKDLNEEILNKFKEEKKIKKNIFEEDIIKDPQNIINYYLNGSLFDENKNILIINNSSDKIMETLNKIKNNINENTIIINSEILDKEVGKADFYYLNSIGYGGMVKYNFNFDKIINEDFYPQTNFYFINVSKTNNLNDKDHVTEIYNKVQNISDYNGKAWEYGFRSCETLLSECVKRNNLLNYHLISKEKYLYLLQFIKQYNIHDGSHKNIMIDGICHFHFPNQFILSI